MKRALVRARCIASAAVLLLGGGIAMAQTTQEAADIAKGKRLFMRCAACHEATNTNTPKIGPHLHKLVGRPMAGVEGYKYSEAMKAKKLVWDDKQLDAWLKKTSDVVPGTTMAFAGMPDPEERKALISFLKTLK